MFQSHQKPFVIIAALTQNVTDQHGDQQTVHQNVKTLKPTFPKMCVNDFKENDAGIWPFYWLGNILSKLSLATYYHFSADFIGCELYFPVATSHGTKIR
jgi:hypothetical protein